MQHSFFHKLSRVLWAGVILLVVLLAVYVSLGRLLMANVAKYEQRILDEVNARVPFELDAEEVRGKWRSFSPELVLTGLRLTLPDPDLPPIELGEGRLALDMVDVLLSRSLQISSLGLDRLRLRGELTEQGSFRIAGFGDGGALDAWLRDFLLNLERAVVTRVDLQLALPGGGQRELQLGLDLHRDGGRRFLNAQLQSSHGTVVQALASGKGNPFRPDTFRGDLYLDIAVADLASAQQAMPLDLPLVPEQGAAALQLWLSWSRGKPRIEGKVDASQLLLRTQNGLRLPIERLAFDASLVERRKRYSLFASDLLLRRAGQDLVLPRLQVDARGDSLRLRTEDVSIAQLNRALVELEVTPERLEQAFRILQPGGQLPALELSVADIRDPAKEWNLRANFQQLALDSWRGAPGASQGSGYVELDESGGQVIIDAQQMALEFPSVYREPLKYEDIHGTVDINWYADAVELRSGLISARGSEGAVRALFGLSIPLAPTAVGLEMDLLAGLSDTSASHRHKYLPYTLDEKLLGWLQQAVPRGHVEEGAFLWRGSLRQGRSAERTIQLFFDVTDTDLNYHPEWPSVQDLDGLVLVDDTNISIWSERARLYDTAVTQLSAEAWLDGERHMQLQLDARTEGQAADGLRVVQHSPLDDITAGAFGDWRLSGALQTELSLALNLSNSARVPPQVRLRSQLTDATLAVEPGGLQMTAINGEIGYDSSRGLYARELRGRLWGEPLALRIGQSNPRVEYRPGESVTEIDFAVDLEMADLQAWLPLDALALATGRTRAEVKVRVPPGAAPEVRVDTDLEGVALDLPAPWAVTAAERRPLAVVAQFSADELDLRLDLAQRLGLQLYLRDGALDRAGLGFLEAPPEPGAGEVLVSGFLPLVDGAEWQAFVQRFLATAGGAASNREVRDPSATASAAPSLGPARRTSPGRAARPTPRLVLDTLQVAEAQLWGRELYDLVLSATQSAEGWEVEAETDWLKGQLSWRGPEQLSTLAVSHLDLAGLAAAGAAEETSGDWQLPPLQVQLRGLEQAGRPLGELAFDLRDENGVLQVAAIRGNLAALQLAAKDDNALRWDRADTGLTRLQARFRFEDLNRTLRRLDYQPMLESSDGRFDVDLKWPGAPWDFGLAGASGRVGMNIDEGRFLQAPAGASGALRVVGILNLAEIVSRASMAQVFEAGIPFRELRGQIELGEGILEVTDLDVQGASSRFQFSGRSRVEEESLEGELVVTLPVASNLPWVAALAAGLPVAAGVFVVSKVFEKQVDTLSSAVYDISGSWTDPQVKFSRIFNVEETVVAASPRAAEEAAPAAAEEEPAERRAKTPAEERAPAQWESPPRTLDPEAPPRRD